MNQSTTQLGSKRRSQGKHLYATFTIFLCRTVNVHPVSLYFCLLFLCPVVLFAFTAWDYPLFSMFLIVHFHQDGSVACGRLSILVSSFEVVATRCRGGFLFICMFCPPPRPLSFQLSVILCPEAGHALDEFKLHLCRQLIAQITLKCQSRHCTAPNEVARPDADASHMMCGGR